MQFYMLRMFVEAGATTFMTIEEAQVWDQRPFRSMLIQRWIAHKPGRGFHVTKEGLKAWRDFQEGEQAMQRRKESQHLPLTAYFDMATGGPRVVAKRSAA